MFPFWPVGFILAIVGGYVIMGVCLPNIAAGFLCSIAWGYFIGEIST